VLRRQHPQAGCEKDDLAREDTQLTLTTLLRTCAAWETDNTNDVSSLDVFVLLLEGCVGLGLLQLAHDLDVGTLCLAWTWLVTAIALYVTCTYKRRSAASWRRSAV
jgi:hypothetical protein